MESTSTARTTWMVWLLAAVGVATGALTLAIVGSALWVAMNAQARHDRLNSRLGNLVELSHRVGEHAQEEFNRLLGDDPRPDESPDWLLTPADLAIGGELARECPALASSLDRVCSAAAELAQLVADCRAWAAERDAMRPALRADRRRDELAARVRTVVPAMHAASHDLRIAQLQASRRQADSIGAVFQIAWRAVLVTGAMATGFFLVTLCTLPRAIGAQLTAIRRNVTELKSARHRLKAQNVALEQAQRRAELASQGKSDFLAMVSHEFRTPLTAVLGFSDMLLESPLPADLGDAAGAIHRNGQHLLSVVNDIMDLSRIEARKLEVRVAPCSLSDTLREAVGVVAARDRRHSVSLDLRFATPFPVAAAADAVRVRQIVTNLVASALDLTEEGQVVITAHCCQEPTPRLCVELFAPGVGLSEAQLQHLFEPFSQSLAASGHGHGDIGLGLSISRRLAILLEGELRVTTDLGRGTRFHLSLPVTWIAGTPWADASDPRTVPSPGPVDDNSEHSKSRETPLTNSAGPIGPARPRILVAEDGPDNQRLIARVLKRIGAEIEMVSNGAQAADLALRNWRTGNTFDVVLMDMQMPVLDGYAATRRLRDAGYDGPIIALTAHAMSHDRQKCLGAGCTDFATKPLEIATLLDMIRRYAGNVAHVTSH